MKTLTVATKKLFGGGREMSKNVRADRHMMATASGVLLTAEKDRD